ncbi:MAG: GntR family transcriptional regulator [Capsulimonas sp.]|uniref:GntR family transcriptional regulator n=1 Tax=Capsulimonas sp. TaxID=2494211 RepID=UPI003262D545
MLAERPATSRHSKNRRGPSPTARQVLTILEERIAGGVYRAGDWLPTERDLVQELGINRAAVRDALTILSESGRITRLAGCRPRVSQPAGDRTNARSAPTTHPYTIAIVLPQHDGDYASREIMRGISRVLRSQETPCRLLVLDINLATTLPEQLEQEACAAVENENIAGAIVWPTLAPETLARWRRIQKLGHPVVFVDRCDTESPCDFVGIDNYTAARDAVEYLIAQGHTRIAHLTDSEPVSSVLQRQAGYRDALLDAGLSSTERLWTLPHHRSTNLNDRLDRYLQEAPLPTAVFALNDFSASFLIQHLETRGIHVPDQISVIGFDDSERYSPRPGVLTTIRQPFERIGQRAAEIFLQRLTSPDPAARSFQHVLLPTQLIERSTCKPLA